MTKQNRRIILHIAAHLGDGAGKAISGTAILGVKSGENTHKILTLDKPLKFNHISRCREAGVEIFERGNARHAIGAADVVVFSWWDSRIVDAFLADFPEVPCRFILWSHNNGLHNPVLPDSIVSESDHFMITTLYSLENPTWRQNSSLIFGFGDFDPEFVCPKPDYEITSESFIIGYIGMPSYKKLAPDYLDYCEAVISRIPNCKFVLLGETSAELKNDIVQRNIERYFHLPGWVSDVKSQLKNFDVYSHLLRPDTFATTDNALVEAMASAVPVVISKYPLGKYLLEEGVSGFTVENPDEYGELMFKLYKDARLRECIGRGGREYAIKTYRPDENLQRFNKACGAVMHKEKRIRIFNIQACILI